MEVQLHTFLFADISGYSTLTELEGEEAAAEAGQLLVTEPAKLAAGELNDANFTALGALQLKNISAPVPVYSLARREAHVYLLYSRKGSALVSRAETGLALAKTGLGGERGLYDL